MENNIQEKPPAHRGCSRYTPLLVLPATKVHNVITKIDAIAFASNRPAKGKGNKTRYNFFNAYILKCKQHQIGITVLKNDCTFVLQKQQQSLMNWQLISGN